MARATWSWEQVATLEHGPWPAVSKTVRLVHYKACEEMLWNLTGACLTLPHGCCHSLLSGTTVLMCSKTGQPMTANTRCVMILRDAALRVGNKLARSADLVARCLPVRWLTNYRALRRFMRLRCMRYSQVVL
jgi:hypothetical protein